MRKMKLRIDDLCVETFAVVGEENGGRGTIAAFQVTQNCLTPDCPPSVEPCVTHDIVCLTRYC